MTAPAVTMGQVMAAFGQPATVTRPAPDDDPIETTVMWLPQQIDQQPLGRIGRVVGKRLIVLRKDEVPTAPRDTQVLVAEPPDGSTVRAWRVDAPVTPSDYETMHGFDHHRLIVVEDESYVADD